MPDRRTFLITCGGVVAAPVFAFGRPPSSASAVTASQAAAPPKLVLRIHGWESPVDSESDVWMHVNSSWCATWR
jgi:hypothetical protein